MAVPPQRIKIKRRRDEEPVETLFIEQKRQRSSYSWLRVESHESPVERAKTLPSPCSGPCFPHQNHGVPIVRSTLQREDGASKSSSSPLSVSNHQQEFHYTNGPGSEPSALPIVGQSNLKKLPPPKPALPTRRFHLSKSKFSSISTHSESRLRVHKFKKRRNELAVFVEKSKRVTQMQDNKRNVTKVYDNTALAEIDIQKGGGVNNAGSRYSLKPGSAERSSSSIESVTTSTPYATQSIDESSTGYSEESIFLAWQLQELALKESPKPTGVKRFSLQPQPKTKPKPPRPRPQKKEIKMADSGGDEPMDDIMDMGNEEDFVYDTYVRSSGHVATMDISEQMSNTTEHLDNNRVGLLIIEDQDQEVWETFAEEDSEKEWDSEEEDENAEDFYGNDYPEDEIDSDDEVGIGVYNHRNRGSDEEEFGEGIDQWSDEEDEAYPWKRNP